MLEVIKRQPREILLSAFARMGEQAPFYIFTAFVFTYGTTVLGATRDLLLTAVLTASVLSFFTIPFSRLSVGSHRPQAHVHDRRGDDGRVRVRLLRAARHDDATAGSSWRFCCR